MSQEFKDWMNFVMFIFFLVCFFSLTSVVIYFIDEYLVDAKKAIVCACVGISCLIIDTIICYIVWG